MAEPETALERKILADVVRQMEDFEATRRKHTRLVRVAFAVGSIGAMLAFLLAFTALAHPAVSAFVAGLAGCALGFGLFLEPAGRQWEITREYVDLDRVRRRLDEIEAGMARQ